MPLAIAAASRRCAGDRGEANGKGFDQEAVGLRSMRESGKMRGGSLRGDSELEAGARVEVRAPLDGRSQHPRKRALFEDGFEGGIDTTLIPPGRRSTV